MTAPKDERASRRCLPARLRVPSATNPTVKHYVYVNACPPRSVGGRVDRLPLGHHSGAGAEIRTRMPSRAADFKSAASACSATPARRSVPAAVATRDALVTQGRAGSRRRRYPSRVACPVARPPEVAWLAQGIDREPECGQPVDVVAQRPVEGAGGALPPTDFIGTAIGVR